MSNKILFDRSAIICESAILDAGNYSITIGANTIIQPTCQILALGGPIEIGPHNIVEERVIITNPLPKQKNNSQPQTLQIGQSNLFEVGCVIESLSIGHGNIFECKSSVPQGVVIGNGSIIGTGVALSENKATIPDDTVIFSPNQLKRQRPNGRIKNTEETNIKINQLRDIIKNGNKLYQQGS